MYVRRIVSGNVADLSVAELTLRFSGRAATASILERQWQLLLQKFRVEPVLNRVQDDRRYAEP